MAKFVSNTSGAILWPDLELMQVEKYATNANSAMSRRQFLGPLCLWQCLQKVLRTVFVAFLRFSRNGVPHLKVLLLELTTQVMGRFN